MSLVAALFLGFLLCAAPAWWAIRREREVVQLERTRMLESVEHERMWMRADLERAVSRVAGLESMLDEIRARETQTTPPPTVTSAPPGQPLPPEIERELAAIEDEEGREELAELARHALRTRPNASVNELVGEVFGGQ